MLVMDNHAVKPPAEQPCVTEVSIKLPTFWPSDPQLSFAQVQAQFSMCGITHQRTMFDYVIALLSPEVTMEIRELILTPPRETPYDVLKEQLIKRTAASEQRHLQQLFSAEELGDCKPSQLLCPLYNSWLVILPVLMEPFSMNYFYNVYQST